MSIFRNLQTMNQVVFDKLNVAYICLNKDMVVYGISDNLQDYGYEGISENVDITDYVDFLVGADVTMELDLPVVISPSGIPISVSLVPDDDQMIVLIVDATNEYEQQQSLQQKANEVQLLSDKQHVLMAQLNQAKKELEHKNKLLEEASRLQAGFLSGVSHEFRTPLSSVIGYTNLLATDSFNNQVAVKEYVSAISRSSKHLLSLVENLLDHGRLQSNELVINPKSIILGELFDDIAVLLKPLADTKYLDFSIKLSVDQQMRIILDDSRLRQCLINVVANAIKFTDKGFVTVTVDHSDDILSVTVSDTGMGIKSEDLNKVLVPFFQAANTGKSGTGLGLSITRRIVELMGGEIEISSEYGKGTEVSMTLLAPEDKTDRESNKVTALKMDRRYQVLLAEDDQDIADLVILLLEQSNIQVTHVLNGALAVDCMKNEGFDLVLMDVHMPVLDGYQAVGAIKQAGFTTPIVIMTASAIEVDRARAESLGCDAYLVKPVDVDDIVKLINDLVVG